MTDDQADLLVDAMREIRDSLQLLSDDKRVSLRDHFAGLAMQGLLATEGPTGSPRVWAEKNMQPALAETAYAIADAMLSAREPRQEKP